MPRDKSPPGHEKGSRPAKKVSPKVKPNAKDDTPSKDESLGPRTIGELKEMPVWLGFKLEPRNNGKIDKVPYYPISGKKRSGKMIDALIHRMTYEQVLAVAEKHGLDGASVAPLPGDRIVMPDLDHVLDENGKVKRLAEPWYDKIRHTYVEVSPSGTGLHAIFRGEAPDGKNSDVLNGMGLETFSAEHHLTFTGKQFNGTDTIAEWTPELEAYFRPLIAGKKRSEEEPPKKRGRPRKFNAASPREVARLKHALIFIDASDYDRWIRVCFAIARAFNHSEEGLAVCQEWSATAGNYDERKTRVLYEKGEEPDNPVTLGSIFDWAKENGYDPSHGEDHYSLAEALISKIEQYCGARPVYTQGQFWIVNEGLWVPWTVDHVACRTGEWFRTEKYCKRGSDFKSIAQIAAQIVNDDRFFETAAIGVASPKHLWAVIDGKLTSTPLTLEHRMRTRVRAEPDFRGKPPLFNALLDYAFKGDKEQRDLLQLLFGAALVQRLWKFQIVVLLYGQTGSGKSVLLKLLREMFLKDLVCAVNPQHWGNEYYKAGLAGKALNLVGELDARHPIVGGPFKDVTGDDLITGRHPTHRPFSFVCQASHIFNGNNLPPTNDRSDAFFRRWRIIRFLNTMPEDKRDQDLATKIIAQESGQVLAWLLKGAEKMSALKAFPRTPIHDELMIRWRTANNSALLFIADECVREKVDDPTLGIGSRLYRAYQTWASETGVRPFGRNGFYEALQDGGLVRKDLDHQPAFLDVRLRSPAWDV